MKPIPTKLKRDVYKQAFGQRKQPTLPLDIAYKIALHKLRQGA